MIRPGDLLTLVPEKAAAGGRMLARHEGMVVLVAGAIPGERVMARADRVEKSLAFATVVDVLEPHPERRPVPFDPRCGGAALAHVNPAWQRRLKADVIADALERIGRVRLDVPIDVAPSPEDGYRMRARLHLAAGRLGLLLEGTHALCDVAATKQLLPGTVTATAELAGRLSAGGLRDGADVEISENRSADQRACHVDVQAAGGRRGLRDLPPVEGLTGLTWAVAGSSGERTAFGSPFVEDVVCGARLRRHVRAFFQGNRYLLEELAGTVVSACPAGDVIDLYAGVGLFSAALAATGRHRVVAVEGHPTSAADLRANAMPFGGALRVEETSVERFASRPVTSGPFTLVLDPPRSGMSRGAAAGAVALGAARVAFVSCDAATFARDVRRFLDGGYRLESLRAFDLFPNTAHIEAMVVLSR